MTTEKQSDATTVSQEIQIPNKRKAKGVAISVDEWLTLEEKVRATEGRLGLLAIFGGGFFGLAASSAVAFLNEILSLSPVDGLINSAEFSLVVAFGAVASCSFLAGIICIVLDLRRRGKVNIDVKTLLADMYMIRGRFGFNRNWEIRNGRRSQKQPLEKTTIKKGITNSDREMPSVCQQEQSDTRIESPQNIEERRLVIDNVVQKFLPSADNKKNWIVIRELVVARSGRKVANFYTRKGCVADPKDKVYFRIQRECGEQVSSTAVVEAGEISDRALTPIPLPFVAAGTEQVFIAVASVEFEIEISGPELLEMHEYLDRMREDVIRN